MGTRGRDRGGGPIEMAVMLPLLLLCVFLTAHLCLVYLAQQAALSAAQIAVAGQRAYGAEPGAGQQRADAFLDQVGGLLTDPDVAVVATDANGVVVPIGEGVQVTATVNGSAIAIIPWFAQTVSRSATGPVERVTGLEG